VGTTNFALVIVGAVLALIGLVMGIVAMVLALRERTATIRVEGEVCAHTHFVDQLHYHHHAMASARYRARLPDGRVVEGTSSIASSGEPPPVGTHVALVYDERNGLREPGSLNDLQIVALAVGGVGVVIIGAGALLVYSAF